MHVWQPPQLESTVGKRVVVSAVVGENKELATEIEQKMIGLAPRDSGRVTQLANSESLQQQNAIRLASATDEEPSDLMLASVARQEEVDFLLRGQILEQRFPGPEPENHLTVSWRLTSLQGQQTPEGAPVVVDRDSAIEAYPDLALQTDTQQILTTAAVRDTYRLITPSISRDRVQLAIPYLLYGSKEVRRGNALAHAGRWAEAEKVWRAVVEKNPTQIAALHNLALAAAAAQEFSEAKALARKAVRSQPTKLHKETLVWIELRQRDYHKSFGIPDPPEGWFVTNESQP